MRITILGSGTSTGVPVIGCHCVVCTSKNPRNQRTRASIVVDNEGFRILIDTPPDMRQQFLREGFESIQSLFYTHLHADHCHGFDDLRAFSFRQKELIPCYLEASQARELRQRFSYAFSGNGYRGTTPQLNLMELHDKQVFSCGGLEVEMRTLPHGNVSTSAFRLGSFVYATDFKAFPADLIKAWQGKIDVMVASGIHFGSHSSHSVIPETMQMMEDLGVRCGIITHLAHEVDYERDQARLKPGIEFAYDGMKIDLPAI